MSFLRLKKYLPFKSYPMQENFPFDIPYSAVPESLPGLPPTGEEGPHPHPEIQRSASLAGVIIEGQQNKRAVKHRLGGIPGKEGRHA